MLPWNVEDLTFDATRFSGVVRLFPLGELVLFPHVMQPLHIFEQRYRDMLNDALDGDGLIAMSLPAPGEVKDKQGRPALLPQICVGKVVSHHRLDDGRYNVMLLGVHRARIVRELPQRGAFRTAEVMLVDEVQSLGDGVDRSAVQAAIASNFESRLPIPEGAELDSNVREMLSAEVPLGVLTDLVSFALPLPSELKRELLAECDADRRASLLLDALNDGSVGQIGGEPDSADEPKSRRRPRRLFQFPPRFSSN